MTIADHPAGRLYVPQARPEAPAEPAVSPNAETPASVTRPTTWSRVDTGFYVASRAGEYVGCVDTTPNGSFVAFDSTSAPIGHYDSLAKAKNAVLAWQPERTRLRDRRLGKALQPVAAGAGLIAAVTATLGALLTVVPS